jgi:hypothetical protein
MSVLDKQFTPRVPEIIREQASDVEKYILDEVSILAQKTGALTECMAENCRVLDAQKIQLDAHDDKLCVVSSFVKASKRWRKTLTALMLGVVPIVSSIVTALLLKWIDVKFHP